MASTTKWKPILIVQVYRLLRAGMCDNDVCKTLGFHRSTFLSWQRIHPELREAVEMARKELEGSESLPEWIYARLSPELKLLWDEIRKWEKKPGGAAKIELMLQDHGRRVRQQLFLHALCMCQYSATAALNKVNVSKSELDRWISNDPDFAELVEEIQWHKGNFFEQQLVKLVEEGNAAAVIFANRTYNQARGYSSHTQVDVSVSGQVLHGVVDLNELFPYLSVDNRLALLEAIRQREKDQESRNRIPSTEELVLNRVREGVMDQGQK